MDIVKWLHDEAKYGFSNSKKLKEAADEIERLREQERKMTNHALDRMEEIERLREALKKIDLATSVYALKNIPEVVSQLARSALQQKESK